MLPRIFSPRSLIWGGVLCASMLAALPSVHAQKQEEGILVKVRTGGSANAESFAFDGANKSFGASAAVGGKQAQVKSFVFGKQASLYGGDGTFHTKSFSNPKGGFKTEAYGTKASAISQHNSFAQSDKGFGTKAMDVREAPGVNQSATVKEYLPAEKVFYGRGKRQDTMDEMTKESKNLSIDQVRDLLNKGPAAKPVNAQDLAPASVR